MKLARREVPRQSTVYKPNPGGQSQRETDIRPLNGPISPRKAYISTQAFVSSTNSDNCLLTYTHPHLLSCFWSSLGTSWPMVILHPEGFSGGSDSKESACNAGDPGSISGLGRSPGEGNGYPLQYFCLENSMNRGAWWATVHGITKRHQEWFVSTLWCLGPQLGRLRWQGWHRRARMTWRLFNHISGTWPAMTLTGISGKCWFNVASHVLGFLMAWQPQGGQRWLRDPRTSVSADKIRATWHNTEMTQRYFHWALKIKAVTILPRCKRREQRPHLSKGKHGRICGCVFGWLVCLFLSCPVESGILVRWPGIEPMPSVLEVQNLNLQPHFKIFTFLFLSVSLLLWLFMPRFQSSLNFFFLTYLYMHLLHSSSDIILVILFPKAMDKWSPGLYNLSWPHADLCPVYLY